MPVAVAMAALVACGREPRPDVVLVTVDTLRTDRVGAYGGTAARTPQLDRLAREGVLYAGATVPLPETRPSHFSLLTSRYPADHGSLSNATRLADEALTLAEVLRDAGYDTAGFVSCMLLDHASGAQQGFAHFDDGGKLTRTAAEVVGAATRWLERRRERRPLFLWVHLFDPHIPYEPPAPFDRPQPGQTASVSWPWLEEAARANGGDLPPAALARAVALYDGEVEYADAQLGRLLTQLERRSAPPLLAVTADHGECFSHGTYFDHSGCLYQDAVDVPLILHWPGRLPRGVRLDAVVSSIQLAPTLLELAGVSRPAEFAGRPLPLAAAQVDAGAAAFFQLPLYPATEIRNRLLLQSHIRTVAGEANRPPSVVEPQLGVRQGGWAYLRRGVDEELYDLAHDPRQQQDLGAAHPQQLRSFRRAVRRWQREHPLPKPAPGEVAPEVLEQLRALGYL